MCSRRLHPQSLGKPVKEKDSRLEGDSWRAKFYRHKRENAVGHPVSYIVTLDDADVAVINSLCGIVVICMKALDFNENDKTAAEAGMSAISTLNMSLKRLGHDIKRRAARPSWVKIHTTVTTRRLFNLEILGAKGEYKFVVERYYDECVAEDGTITAIVNTTGFEPDRYEYMITSYRPTDDPRIFVSGDDTTRLVLSQDPITWYT